MAMKKGQITAFIIVGIVLLILMSIMFYIINQNKTGNAAAKTLESVGFGKDVYNFVRSCSLSALEQSKNELLLSGGKYEGEHIISYLSTNIELFTCPENIPQQKEIEDNLGKKLIEKLDECIKGFSPLAEIYEISVDNAPIAHIEMQDNSIIARIGYGFTVKKGTLTKRFDLKSISINTDAKELFDASRDFIATCDESLNIGYLAGIAHFHNIEFFAIPESDQQYIIALRNIQGESIIFGIALPAISKNEEGVQ